jgi:hypothetical protein
MKEKVMTHLIGFMALLCIGLTVQAQTATLISDQPDYMPGTTATFTGSGFQPGEIVKVKVLHFDGTTDEGEDHQQWQVTADANGNFITTWHVCEDDCSGSTLKATADGLSSLIHAEVVFTDSAFTSAASGKWSNVDTWIAVARTGTITSTLGSPAISGSGTLFMDEIQAGDKIFAANGTTPIGTVLSISSNTSLTLTSGALNNNLSGFSAKRIPGPTDMVTITAKHLVEIDAPASCLTLQVNNSNANHSFTFGNNANTSLTINAGQLLTVGGGTGSVTIGSATTPVGGAFNGTSITVAGTLLCGPINLRPGSKASTPIGRANTFLFIKQTGIVTVIGNVSGATIPLSDGNFASASVQFPDAGGILNLTGSFTTSEFIASSACLVNYNNEGSQPVRGATYGKLAFSGSGIKATSDGVTVQGELSIKAGVTANLGTSLHATGTLKLGGSGTGAGTWGSTTSTAVHTNNIYFAPSTGRINVLTGTCSNPPAPVAANNTFIYDGQSKTAAVTVGTGETVAWFATATGPTTAVAPMGINAGTYSAYAEAISGCVSISRTLVTLTINKAHLTVQANNHELTYGDDVPELSYQITGFANNETMSVVSGNAILTTNYTNSTNAATAGITITTSLGSLSAANYNFSPVNGQITISKAQASFSNLSASQTIDYGTPTITLNGILQAPSGAGLPEAAVSISLNNIVSTVITDTVGSFTATFNTSTLEASAIPYIIGYAFADENYLPTTDNSTALTIDKANAFISIVPYNEVYDQNAHTAIGTVVGVHGEDLAGLNLTATSHTNAALYATDAWTFTDLTGNYNNANGTVSNLISKADPVIMVTPYEVTYNAAAHTASGTAKGISNEDLAGLDLTATTHTNAGPYATDTWTFTDVTGNYKKANGTVNNLIKKADPVIVVTPYTVTYNASAHTATGTAKGINNENLAGLDLTATTHTNAAPYATDSWTFTDVTGNYNNADGIVSNLIKKADPVIVVTPYTVTYNASPHKASGTAKGISNEDLAGLDLTATTHTNAAPYAADAWTFTDVTGNYNNTNGTISNLIKKADPVIVVTPYTVTYNASPHTAIGTAKGINNEDLASLDLTATTHNIAGPYATDAWTFTDVTGNYHNANGTVTNLIKKADPVIVVNPYEVTYNAAAHTASGTAKGISNEDLAGLDLTATTHTNAAPYATDAWTFTDVTGNYNDANGTVTNLIKKADPVIVVTPYSVIYDAAAHTATGTARGVIGENLTGLVLTATTHTNAGTSGTDTWSFSDVTGNYNSTNGTVSNVIGKATLTITSTSQSVLCGQAIPAFTGTYSGANETFLIGGTTTAISSSEVGTYPIYPTVVSGSNLSNYNVRSSNGTLTILGVIIDANANVTPKPVSAAVTLVTIKITNTAGSAAPGVLVTLYVDDKPAITNTTDANGIAGFNLGVLATDVYRLRAVAGSGCAETTVYMPVYDPAGGFITGGGWINSPIYPALQYMQVSGKANFGFVSKYEKGKTIPTGNTEFQFKEGGMNFSSTSFDWLVINGKKAQYKGTGTINGTGTFGFILTAVDGDLSTPSTPDLFRIKIYNKTTNKVVYDNQYGTGTTADDADPTTLLGGGSIVIHEVKNGKVASTTPVAGTSPGMNMPIVEPLLEQRIKLTAYPNPFAKQATIAFTLPTDEQLVTLDMFDLKGSRIKRVYDGKAAANQTLEFDFNGNYLSPGIYLLRLATPTRVENFKMIMIE